MNECLAAASGGSYRCIAATHMQDCEMGSLNDYFDVEKTFKG